MTTSPFTEENDVRSLTNAANTVQAGAGDDIVFALGGNDSVEGEEGNDLLRPRFGTGPSGSEMR